MGKTQGTFIELDAVNIPNCKPSNSFNNIVIDLKTIVILYLYMQVNGNSR